jgi:hypothetical protein
MKAGEPVGGIFRWYLTRTWARYYANPKAVIFPKICPVCLGPAEVFVEEESTQRVTANYIVVRQLEWWNAKIPHCSKCQRKQVRNIIIGLALVATCAIVVFILTPAPEPPTGIVLYILFAYPF